MLAAAGCGGTEPEPTATPLPPTDAPPSEPVTGTANVESIQILMLESFPVQVNARMRGVLPDGCTTCLTIRWMMIWFFF